MNEDVGEIKRRLDIVDLVGSYLTLKRKGRNFAACCPFHQEKTPSFFIFPDKQNYMCFGCQEGGDIFTFMMNYENMTFPEAKKELAKMAGVQLTTTYRKIPVEVENKWDAIMESALRFFRQQYKNDEARKAREYVSGRQFNLNTLELFEIGYAPDRFDALLKHCRALSFNEDDLLKCGLIKKNEKGHVYDFFRGRIIFPVRSKTGRLLAFGGRMIEKGEPKYLNSPETPFFKKSETLFNLSRAKDKIREFGHILLMEGYTDVMMADQTNVGPAVATLGTALTEDHVRVLKRYQVPVMMIYDGDKAGQKATERSLPILLKFGVDARAISLPGNSDPCEFLSNTEQPEQEWKRCLQEGQPVFDFKLNHLIESSGQSVEDKTRIAHTLLEDLKACQDPIRCDAYLTQLSEKLQIDKQALILKMGKPTADKTKKTIKNPLKRTLARAAFDRDACFFLLAILIVDQSYTAELEERTPLIEFPDANTSRLLQKWLDAHHDAEDLALPLFTTQLTDDELQIFNQAMSLDLPEKDAMREMFYENFEKLRKPESMSELKSQLKEAMKNDQRDEVRKLTIKMQKLASGGLTSKSE